MVYILWSSLSETIYCKPQNFRLTKLSAKGDLKLFRLTKLSAVFELQKMKMKVIFLIGIKQKFRRKLIKEYFHHVNRFEYVSCVVFIKIFWKNNIDFFEKKITKLSASQNFRRSKSAETAESLWFTVLLNKIVLNKMNLRNTQI